MTVENRQKLKKSSDTTIWSERQFEEQAGGATRNGDEDRKTRLADRQIKAEASMRRRVESARV